MKEGEFVRCHACGDESLDGKRFCPNCGTSLTGACTNCGAELIPGQRFCGDCGTPSAAGPLAEAPTAVPAADPVAERRLCSVLFVDLVGFTPLAERADPEEIREFLGRYFERAQAIISNYGGTVEKFIGDAVMAVWGAPVANEDDAERAVRAALEVVSSVNDLGREEGYDGLSARGGIVTGEVAITIGKVSEGMVLGDTVNTASRVQGAAEPGTVLVDEVTWRASSDAIAFEAVGPLTLKGKAESVNAWRALRVVGQRKGLGRSERLEPPFVGRDDELRLVKDLLHATSREQRSRLVSVTGVPGIGKSRLAWEFLKYVDGLADTVYWHQGRSSSYGEGIAFGALGEMVRMRAGINEVDDGDEARRKLSACVARYVAEETERRWIEPRLAHLLGLSEAPTTEREELFSSWRTFFERISSAGLVVLVFEDLQWADPGLIDYVESILEWSRSYPIMVVTLSRPELRDLRPDWGAGQRSFTSIHLDPLSDDAMRAMLNGFVNGLPEAVTKSVLDRAEGVPLYAVETVRMMVDRGVLRDVDGIYRVEGDFASLDIPETLHALIASRLDALALEQRVMLQDAAVLGTMFLPESLHAVSGIERAILDGHLRDLVRKEFLRFETDPRSPERGQYGFVQGVIGDVALSMLSRRDLSAKHLIAARYYESIDDEELTAVIAAHYASAFRAAPDSVDSEEAADRAQQWLRRAGERALSLGSPEQALDLLEQALLIAPAGPAHPTLLELAGDAALAQGDLERASALFEQSIGEFTLRGQVTSAGLATAKFALSLRTLDRVQESVDVATGAYNALGESGDLRARGVLSLEVASSIARGSNPGAALEWSERALMFSELLDDTLLFARALAARSFGLFNVGRHREAVLLVRECISLSVDAGSLRDQALATLSLSLYVLPDNMHETFTRAMESAEISRRAGLRPMEISNMSNAAETAVSLGLWDESLAILEECGSRSLRPQSRVWIDLVRAMIIALRGDAEGAQSIIASWATETRNIEFVAIETTILHATGMVHYASGDFAQAHHCAARALELDPVGINAGVAIALLSRSAIWMKDVGAMSDALEAAGRVRGRFVSTIRTETRAALAAVEGRDADAGELYATALDEWRDLNSKLDLALTELEMAHLLAPEHPLLVNAKEADDIFTELRAAPFLRRLRDALAG